MHNKSVHNLCAITHMGGIYPTMGSIHVCDCAQVVHTFVVFTLINIKITHSFKCNNIICKKC
jgi:hypothetical protein